MATQLLEQVFPPAAWNAKLETAARPQMAPAAAPPCVSYEIRQMTQADGPRMIAFLRRLFFRDEPLNVAVKLIGPGEDTCLELEDYCLSSLPENLSLMAVEPSTDELLAVCINGVHEPGLEEEAEREAAACPNPKFRKILQLLTYVDSKASAVLARRYPDPEDRRQLEVRILSVDGAARGRGLATALIDRTRDLARQDGLPLVRVDCTSHYSGRAVSRLGFECIYSIPYAEYKRDGELVFEPADPHKEVATYIHRVV